MKGIHANCLVYQKSNKKMTACFSHLLFLVFKKRGKQVFVLIRESLPPRGKDLKKIRKGVCVLLFCFLVFKKDSRHHSCILM